jgi:hypothetical protein
MADEPEEVTRDEILAQIRRRKIVEEQIQALGGILASVCVLLNWNVSLFGNLKLMNNFTESRWNDGAPCG